ncbi:hypothetical protein FKM82_031386 [Ascaphus truei]
MSLSSCALDVFLLWFTLYVLPDLPLSLSGLLWISPSAFAPPLTPFQGWVSLLFYWASVLFFAIEENGLSLYQEVLPLPICMSFPRIPCCSGSTVC